MDRSEIFFPRSLTVGIIKNHGQRYRHIFRILIIEKKPKYNYIATNNHFEFKKGMNNMNITIRNIPDDVITKIKTISEMEKRSLNSEILMVLEKGMQEEIKNRFKIKNHISKSSQINIWKKLSNSWQDDRTTEEIKNDIYENRTLGREIDL